jgi:DNA-binding transcriptional MerR regulator
MTQHWVPRHITRYGERADVEQLRQRLQALKATGMQDQAIAMRLSTEGFSTGTGGPFTRGIVWSLRKRWSIGAMRPARRQSMQRQWPDGSYTLAGVAALIGVHIRTVHTWIARGMLVPSQVYKGGPVKIALTEEQIGALRDYVARVRRPRRTRGTGSAEEATCCPEVDEALRRLPPSLEAEPGAHELRHHPLPDAVTTTPIAAGGHRHVR